MAEVDMNEEKPLLDEALRAVAADQDAFVGRMPHSPDDIAEEAVHRAWKPTRQMRLFPYLAMAGVAATVAFVVAFVVSRADRNDLRFEIAGRAGQAGATVTAQDGSPLPLRFSDGSVLTFQPGAQARVARLHDSGAELMLDSGHLVADVRHTDQAHWSVVAGPFTVRVTGTRFGVDWSPASGKLVVEMFEGSVIVEGPSLGQGLALRGGESLDVGITSPAVVTRTQPEPAVPAPAKPVPSTQPSAPVVAPVAAAPSAAPAQVAPRPQVSWSELADNGRYTEALAAAEREGFLRLCRQLDTSGLLALGDAARYASSPIRARQAFEALVRRFSRDQRSQDALFALGRLEFEAGAPSTAARWFERYLTTARNPPLGEEAVGRLIEIYDRAGDGVAAERAAKLYLERHPNGLRTGLARKVLAARSPTEVPR
jgi:ferric-dicitrate binding protein FerR (iron transport regulator)